MSVNIYDLYSHRLMHALGLVLDYHTIQWRRNCFETDETWDVLMENVKREYARIVAQFPSVVSDLAAQLINTTFLILKSIRPILDLVAPQDRNAVNLSRFFVQADNFMTLARLLYTTEASNHN